MKRITILAIILIAMLNVSAQGYEKKESKPFKFDVESGIATDEVFVLEGDAYPIFVTKTTDSQYIKAISFTGTKYPVWIHKKTGDTFKGKDVYITKKGKYCIYNKTSSNYPVPDYSIEKIK